MTPTPPEDSFAAAAEDSSREEAEAEESLLAAEAEAVGEGVEGGLWERPPGAEARARGWDGAEGGGALFFSFSAAAREAAAAFGDSSSSASAAVPREKSSKEGVWVSLPPVVFVGVVVGRRRRQRDEGWCERGKEVARKEVLRRKIFFVCSKPSMPSRSRPHRIIISFTRSRSPNPPCRSFPFSIHLRPCR